MGYLILYLALLIIAYFIVRHLTKPNAVGFTVKAGIPEDLDFTNTIKNKIIMFTLKSFQRVSFELTPVNRLGNPAQVEPGTVVVSSSDETIFTVVPDPENELKGFIYSTAENVGVAQLNFKADADLGSGVEEISGFAAVTHLPLGAVGFGVIAGTPEDLDPPTA